MAGDGGDGGAALGRGRRRRCGAPPYELRRRWCADRRGDVDGGDGVVSLFLARPAAAEEVRRRSGRSGRARGARLAARNNRTRGLGGAHGDDEDRGEDQELGGGLTVTGS